MVPHVAAERGDGCLVQFRAAGQLLLGPLGMAFREVFRMFGMHPDRVLQHRRQDALRCRFDRLQTVAATDAATQDVEFVEAEVIHQRHVVGGIGVPAMIGLDGGAGRAGVALVHRHRGEPGLRQRLGPIHPWSRRPAGGRGPHFHTRPQPSGGEQQHREAISERLVMDLAVRPVQYGHRILLCFATKGASGGGPAQDQPRSSLASAASAAIWAFSASRPENLISGRM
jgi:hypothetical protein